MHLTRSALALPAIATLFTISFSAAKADTSLSIPSSPEIAATTPAGSSHGRRGVVSGLDSNPWIPVAAVLATIAAGPVVRRYLAS